MKRYLRGLWYGIAAAVLSACAGVESGPARPAADKPKQLRERQIIVTLADDTPERWAETTRALASQYGLPEVGNFPLSSIRVQCVVFEVPGERSEQELLTQLRADPRVESVQLNQVFAGTRAAHSDPYGALAYGAAAIHADKAHRVATGKGVRLVIVDTGVDKDHPDLRGRITKTQNFVEGGEASFSRDRHGTAVAGVIAARANDGVGIYGVAPETEVSAAKACWYPEQKSARALCSSWTLAKAIDFAINAGAQVLNLSLNGPADRLLARLLARAHAGGITVVAAAAQDATEPGFPASAEHVIAVLASDNKGQVQLPAWSLDKPMVAAPGIDILSTAPRESYDFFSGSSLATAYVAGVAALLLEKNPQLTPQQVAELLSATTQPTAVRASSAAGSVGVVDACAALAKLLGKNAC